MKLLNGQRPGAGFFAAAGMMVLLASCAGQPQKSVMTDYKPPVTTPGPAVVPAPKAKQVTPEPTVSKPEPAPVVVKTRPVPAPPPPPKALPKPEPEPEPVVPKPVADDILGVSPEEVTGLLGVPRLIRRESPAQVWQYTGQDCVLHVFLYGTASDDTFKVDHLEATDLHGGLTSTEICFAELVDPG